MTAEHYVPNPNVRLVLNGGKNTLDAATIPVEWHFSEELLAKKPRYVVICDHEKPLPEFMEEVEYYLGHRHSFEIKDLVGYIQLHTPGKHHFVVFVFYGEKEEALSSVRCFLEKRRDGAYDKPINYNHVRDGKYQNDAEVIAVDFEIPKELFAEKSQTPFGRFVWSWTNRWFKRSPVDQCEYRKRKWFAFTVQPPLFLLGRSFTGVFLTLYTLVGGFFLLFFGVRPIVAENLRDAWLDPESVDDLRKFKYSEKEWRRWDKNPDRFIPVWAVPAVVIAILVFVVAAIHVAISLWDTSKSATVVVLVMLMAIVAIIPRYEIWKEKQAKAFREEREEEDDKYLAYLRANAALNSTPEKVDLKSILPKVDRTTRFRLSFWGLKAKVCRPFAK